MGRENPNPWDTPRKYKIPAGIAKPGRNTLAVRVYSYAFAGGMMGSAADLNLGPEGIPDSARIYLSGSWQYKVEHNFGKITPLALQQPLGPGNPNSPSILFNGMIKPLIPYAMRGGHLVSGRVQRPENPGIPRALPRHDPQLASGMAPGEFFPWRREGFSFSLRSTCQLPANSERTG